MAESAVIAASSAALVSNPSPADASAYTPVLSSVKLLTQRVSSNGLVRSSLQKLQSIVPESVTAQALSGAERVTELSDKYAAPLVTRVDSNLSNYIIRILALPAYGSAKVHQADELAYSYTPDFAKPTYAATRVLVADTIVKAKEVSGRTVETVKRVKTERQEALWNALEQLATQVAALKQAVATSSTQARQALDLHNRLTDLQTKVAEATASKRAQARHRSQEILSSVTELGTNLTGYLESNLSTQQRDTLHQYWSKLLDGVSALKDSLHLGGAAPASSQSSRSDSGASSSSEGAVAPAVAAESEVAAAPAVNANGEQVLTEPAAAQLEVVEPQESENKSAPVVADKKPASANKRANKNAAANSGKVAKSAQLQQQDEEKQKVDAENE